MFLLLLACTEYGVKRDEGVPGAGQPDIEVSPGRIDFGSLDPGEESVGSFTVQNAGDEGSILTLDSLTIEGGNASFTVLTDEADWAVALEAGAEVEIEVAYSPLGANNEGRALIGSDDPDEAVAEVELVGTSAVPDLQIDPDPLDMGDAYLECDKENTLTLTNVGSADLVIEEIEEDGEAFSLVGRPALPLTLAPGESETVDVIFVPYEERDYEGGITVWSNEPASPYRSPHFGAGRMGPTITDHFEVPVDPPADILFFVDQSCSMDDNARELASNFSSFIGQISNYTTDWRVAVVTHDDGCNNNGILTASTSDYEGKFSDAVVEGSDSTDNYTEAGLYMTEKAIQSTDPGECNAGFLRPTALLHIIMVTDEPEQSPQNWDYYVDSVIAKKGNAGLVKYSAVAGDVPGGCATADAGTGYYDAVQYTGGEFLSICSQWSTNVGILANASVEQEVFTLTADAVEPTLQVEVNGSSRTSGWRYDAQTHSVIFETNIPGEGDVIDITYSSYVNCD